MRHEKKEECFKMMDKWIAYCKRYNEMHNSSWEFMRKLNLYTSIPSLVFSSISGIGIIGLTPGNDSCNTPLVNTIFLYIMGCMGIISGCLVAINRFAKLAESEESHSIYSFYFEILKNDIEFNYLILFTESAIYKNPIEYIKVVKSRLDSLIEKAPQIPRYIEHKFKEKKEEDEDDVTDLHAFTSIIINDELGHDKVDMVSGKIHVANISFLKYPTDVNVEEELIEIDKRKGTSVTYHSDSGLENVKNLI